MKNKLKRLAAGLLIALLIAGTCNVTSAEAALARPTNCRFVRWNNYSFTSCRVGWKKVAAADYYEIKWSYRDGSNYNHRYQYSSYAILDITGLNSKRIYKVQVRALKVNNSGSITAYSSWSNIAYITPLPHTATGTLTGSNKNKVKVTWNTIAGCNGYKVFVTTNPSGTWYLNQQTKKAGARTVTISKYRGKKLAKYTNYYVRIVPKRIQGGKQQKVPVPASDYWLYRFYIYTVTK